MLKITLPILSALSLAALAGCGSGPSLSTGSLIGNSSSAQPAAPKPTTATDRALLVGATSARAQRCGFVFDPEQLKANFLAAEQQAGTPPDQLPKITREFDFTRQSVLTAIAKDEAYCTDGRNREVKAALTRQLAGDFNPPQRRNDINVGWFEHQKKEQPFDGNQVFERSTKQQRTLGGDN